MRTLVTLAMLVLLPELGAGATFVVTKGTDDDGPCTPDDCALREAVLEANALPGPDIILLSGGTYRLTILGLTGENDSLTGDLDIRDELEIRGDPIVTTTIESAVGNERVIHAIGDGSLTLVDLEITGGRTPEGGGGIRAVVADLEMRNCNVHSNQAGFDGGGLFIGLNHVRLIDSTIANNTTDLKGGGLSVRGSSVSPTSLLLENVTISGNFAATGGAIYAAARSDRHLLNVTISGNQASLVDGVLVDLITSQAMQWTNTLTDDDCGFISSPAPISGGGNMESPGATCAFPDPTDQMNVSDLMLGPLADNGGPTPTHALLPGSPAIDGGVDSDCPSQDQRGATRPVDGNLDGIPRCDVGAFELDTSVTDVPTVGSSALAILSLLLAVAAVRVIRRQATVV